MNIVLVASAGQCGIYEYSQILLEGFRQAGHQPRYIGVRNKDNRDLGHQLKQIRADEQIIIFEYEPGIFEIRGLVMQMMWLRLRGKRVILSVHEIEPAKYGEYHYILNRLGQPARFQGPLELARLIWATLTVAYRYLTLRMFLVLMGWLPQQVIVHSRKAETNIGIVLADRYKLRYVPLAVKQLEGNRDEIRQELGLAPDRFAFIIPGFLFRRKRIIEVIEQLPPESELWVVGTESEYDPGYLEEIETHLAQSGKQERVRIIQDYENMERYLLAADAVVLYYSELFQSAVACLAIGAGKPCIFSDLPAFSDLREAGLIVRTAGELRQAMLDIQDPERYRQLVAEAERLQTSLSPVQTAVTYIRKKVN
jgi:glycosyltransferase involved in cell wall biosynthesis